MHVDRDPIGDWRRARLGRELRQHVEEGLMRWAPVNGQIDSRASVRT
jgi:hypothetical protein